MHRLLPHARILLLGLALIAAAVLVGDPQPTAHTKAEIMRLQQHFESVEAELAARDISQLSEAQRAARARNIAVLREYAHAAVFPHNHDFASQRVPYFRDEHGTLCAMAYLIARSGRQDLVERIARTDNNEYLPDLARDPELRAWLVSNGLTVDEAARIQPAYGYDPTIEQDHSYEIASVTASVISGGAITWTLLSDPKRAGYLLGFATIVIGAGDLLLAAGGALSEADPGLPELNAIVGGATTIAGIAYIVRVLNARAHTKAAPDAASAQFRKWQPLLHNDADGRTRIGVNLRL